jgi:serine/threonine protein kinase
MSQPRTESEGSEGSQRVPPGAVPASPPGTPADSFDALAAHLAGPLPNDDTPTIISRHLPRPETPPADSLRGRLLAHFELIEPIGVGGMAAVLRARDTQLDRCVALKILPPEMAADPENVRRFHQEARSAAKLDHENIARVFFCGEDQRLHFIAFEFVEGENLRTILERRGRLPVGEALHYMLQVSAGLAHAARRGVVHRDIKPSNIIITPTGRAKLVDMGLARCLERQHDRGLTQSGVTLGTFDYISPEQALEPRDADVRSDIYSLGCTFYHMLTGRPPVPEGTAAKKLHHHQHVKPVDPRQFLPELPDDVVVILARMMAKQPKDRYQSPEELVQDLFLAARKSGATPEVPEGVLSVEADLPNRPRGGPLLLTALAALAVVGLIVLVDQPGPGPSPRHANLPTKDAVPRDKGPESTPTDPVAAVHREHPARKAASAGARTEAVYDPPEEPTAEHLLDWLRDHKGFAKLVINLAGVLDVSSLPDENQSGRTRQGLAISATQEVIVQAKDPRQPPTLLCTYALQPDPGPYPGPRIALAVHSRQVKVRGVRFLLDLRQAHDTAMVGLLLRGGGKHLVERCEFIQGQPAFKVEDKRLASLVIQADRRARSEVKVNECCFLGFGKFGASNEYAISGGDPRKQEGGQDAVVRRGPARLLVSNCAFGPHAATFRLEGSESSEVSVQYCSVLAARQSAVFDVPGEGGASLKVEHSLFSRWGETGCAGGEGENAAVLIRQAEESSRVALQGGDNCYHNLDGYWMVGGALDKASWAAFKNKPKEEGDNSRVLVSHPWKIPTAEQFQALEKRQVLTAFALNPRLAALRLRGRPDTLQTVGVEKVLARPLVSGSLPELSEKAATTERRYLVVEPGSSDSSNGIYRNLAQAVGDARPGDTILIRSNDVLEIPPISLNTKESYNLKIRPYRRFHPVLTLGEASETDAAMFRVYHGKLDVEGLEFRLKPSKEFKVQAVVALLGDGDCRFKDCLFTLDRNGRETALTLTSLVAPGKDSMPGAMRSTRKPEQGPRLALEGCFVRGDGDLLWGRASRPCELSVKNTLAALSGSFLNLDMPRGAEAPAEGKVDLQLNKVTTYLGGHLLRLGAGNNPKGLMPVRCQPHNCLFVPSATARALVHLDGPELDLSKDKLKEKLEWSGGSNAYGKFPAAVDQKPPGDEMVMSKPMDMTKWMTFSGEEDKSNFDATLITAPASDTPFTQIKPGDFKHSLRRGADLAQLARLLK